MKHNSEAWAVQLTKVHGPQEALRIIRENKRPVIGTDGSVPNPHKKFYDCAFMWMKRFHAEEVAKPVG
jgi:hypothetical protein